MFLWGQLNGEKITKNYHHEKHEALGKKNIPSVVPLVFFVVAEFLS